MLELVLAITVIISVVVIHALRNNKHQEKETINEKELWPVSFYLIHEPRTEKDHEWFVTSAAYFQNYDARLLVGIGRKEALKILALASRTNNVERFAKNSCQAYRINGYVLRNKEAKFVVRNANGKLVSVQISKITAFRIIASSKNQKRQTKKLLLFAFNVVHSFFDFFRGRRF
jgi:superfamily II DNA or RNA helicase